MNASVTRSPAVKSPGPFSRGPAPPLRALPCLCASVPAARWRVDVDAMAAYLAVVATFLVSVAIGAPSGAGGQTSPTCRNDAEAKYYGYTLCVQGRPTNTYPR